MAWKKVVLRFDGAWEGLEYKGGEEGLLLIPPSGICYSELLKNIQEHIQVNPIEYSYMLYALADIDENKVGKVKIKNDSDVNYFFEYSNELVIFVILKKLNTMNSVDMIHSQIGLHQQKTHDVPESSYRPRHELNDYQNFGIDWGIGDRSLAGECDNNREGELDGDGAGDGGDDTDDDDDNDDLFENDVHRQVFEEFSDYIENRWERAGFGEEQNNTTSDRIDPDINLNEHISSRWNIPGIYI